MCHVLENPEIAMVERDSVDLDKGFVRLGDWHWQRCYLDSKGLILGGTAFE